MKSGILTLAMVAVLAGVFAGCSDSLSFDPSHSYLGGCVVVDCQRNNRIGATDCVVFRFCQNGTYKVSFSALPDRPEDQNKLPQDFLQVVSDAPKKVVVEQCHGLEHLVVKIEKDGKTESIIFQ